VITAEPSPALETVWREVARRLAKVLRGNGVPPDDIDDIVQDVATRALHQGVRFTSADDLLPWAITVARRRAIDSWRRERGAIAVLGEAEGLAADDDVARQVEGRLQLAAVRTAWTSLTPEDQQALAANTVEGLARRDAVRLNVRRHRARARLAALVEGVAVIAAWLRRKLPLTRRLGVTPAGLVVVTVAAVIVPLLWVTSGSGTDHDGASSVEPASKVVLRHSTPTPKNAAGTHQASRARIIVGQIGRLRRPTSSADLPPINLFINDPRTKKSVAGIGSHQRAPHEPLLCVRPAHGVPNLCLGRPLTPTQ
jgi:DNA-directed RNA polymerase specialized sigma24 family protein